jgi:hypothetical protein
VKILFDENVPLPLRDYLSEDEITTVQQLGWSGISNGELVQSAEGKFDILILADKNLRYQQNLSNRRLAFVELPSNRWPLVKALATRIVAAVKAASPGSYTIVEM